MVAPFFVSFENFLKKCCTNVLFVYKMCFNIAVNNDNVNESTTKQMELRKVCWQNQITMTLDIIYLIILTPSPLR
jgi:hypothetical protein